MNNSISNVDIRVSYWKCNPTSGMRVIDNSKSNCNINYALINVCGS